jgi:hypothetical protein
MWRKQGGAEALQNTVTASQTMPQPTNGNHATAAQSDPKSKRLNPIKRKQMEDRMGEVEREIARLETAIAGCETALQAFVSAEETQRVSQELSDHKSELQSRMTEWEELGAALEA